MQNILITHPEGHRATGLVLLREAVARALPTAKQTIIVPKHAQAHTSFASDPERLLTAEPETLEANALALDLSPADVIRRAFLTREEFSTTPWDLVLTGINAGLVTGWDVFEHPATASGMLAAHAFLAYAVVFNQELDEGDDPQDRLPYQPAERIVQHYLKTTPLEKGRCWNVNIPSRSAHHRGYKETNTAHYSPTHPPSTDLVPRARQENSDVTATEEGFTALTSLDLRVNPSLRF